MSYIGVIDCERKLLSFVVYRLPDTKPRYMHSVNLMYLSPKVGWYEHKPMQIVGMVKYVISSCLNKMAEKSHSPSAIAAVGICTLRETTLAWDARTGRPLHNAITSNDIRSTLLIHSYNRHKDRIRYLTGLPVTDVAPALKMRWLLDNVTAIKEAVAGDYLRFGTMDTWLVWNLTNGALHVTDVTHASRTLLMNIDTLQWDQELLTIFGIKRQWLPAIHSCSEIYGTIDAADDLLPSTPISSIIDHRQAALVGLHCMRPGTVKNSYRAGCLLLYNTGTLAVRATNGLLTTVAYKLGPDAPPHYALEATILIAGHVFTWLEKRLGILSSIEMAVEMANMVPTTRGVYFVPAFNGTSAPNWEADARGLIIGLTEETNKYHVVRAAFESICFQTRDILEAIREVTNEDVHHIVADGIIAHVDLVMQMQADIMGVSVHRPRVTMSNSLGAAMLAAQADGINLFAFNSKHPDGNIIHERLEPLIDVREREAKYEKWQRAVESCLKWAAPLNLPTAHKNKCELS